MPKLYIVPTPIGNLEDITLRALNVFKECEIAFCEDTRTTAKLFSHYGISIRTMAYHMNNEHKTMPKIIDIIKSSGNCCLVSDAGTPGISDPGFLLIRECIKEGIEVECLPGATAFVPALVASGLPSDKFLFYGFLPHKKGRMTALKEISENEFTTVLYESPHRIQKLLEQMLEHFSPERQICVAREITKIHETYFRGTVPEAIEFFNNNVVKGEFVVVIEGKR